MSDFDPTPYLPRNPVVHARHRNDVLWQITVPVVAGAVVLIVLGVFAWLLRAGDASRWGDVSLIWLIIPAFFSALIAMAVLVGLIYLTVRLIGWLPYQFYRLEMLLLRLYRLVDNAGNKASAPVIKARGWKAGLGVLLGRPRRGSRDL